MPLAKDKGPLADRVTTPDQRSFLNLMVYGLPGAGKTWLSGTAQDHPMTSPVLFLDVEGGTTTLRHRPDLHVIHVRKPTDIAEAHNILRTDNDGYYKTVVIDSLSELQDVDMMEIMRQLVQAKPDRDPDVPDRREWGIGRTHMRKIVRAFRDLEVNTIFTALLNIDKDETTGAITYGPNFPGKLKIELPGFLDVVGYLYATSDGEETKRIIQFAQTRRVLAKDRTSAFGDKLDNPSIPMMWDMLNDGKKPAK